MRTTKEIIFNHGALTGDSLIPLLQEVQGEVGYLSSHSLEEIAEAVRVPVSKVYGVATFYRQFRFARLGEHVIEICRGTACHVKQSAQLKDHLKRRLKLGSDGNSKDGRFSLVTVACLGACSIAPVIRLDGEFFGHLTSEKIDRLLDRIEVKQ